VESVRSSRAGGNDDGGEDDVKQAPAFSILATRRVSISVRGLRGADTTGVCVWTLPDDAAGGGGVGLLTSDVILYNSVDDVLGTYVHSCIHALNSFLIQNET
jgi:hypothetical protein